MRAIKGLMVKPVFSQVIERRLSHAPGPMTKHLRCRVANYLAWFFARYFEQPGSIGGGPNSLVNNLSDLGLLLIGEFRSSSANSTLLASSIQSDLGTPDYCRRLLGFRRTMRTIDTKASEVKSAGPTVPVTGAVQHTAAN